MDRLQFRSLRWVVPYGAVGAWPMTRDAWRFDYRDKRRKAAEEAMKPFEMTEARRKAIDDARKEQENEGNE